MKTKIIASCMVIAVSLVTIFMVMRSSDIGEEIKVVWLMTGFVPEDQQKTIMTVKNDSKEVPIDLEDLGSEYSVLIIKEINDEFIILNADGKEEKIEYGKWFHIGGRTGCYEQEEGPAICIDGPVYYLKFVK